MVSFRTSRTFRSKSAERFGLRQSTFFQGQKFAKTEHEDQIRRAKSPMIATRFGRDRERPLRNDWESVKDSIMREAVTAKFDQYPDLRVLLLETGDRKIIEHTENDSYWGDGGDGSGKNMMGILLMEIRQKPNENANKTPEPTRGTGSFLLFQSR